MQLTNVPVPVSGKIPHMRGGGEGFTARGRDQKSG